MRQPTTSDDPAPTSLRLCAPLAHPHECPATSIAPVTIAGGCSLVRPRQCLASQDRRRRPPRKATFPSVSSNRNADELAALVAGWIRRASPMISAVIADNRLPTARSTSAGAVRDPNSSAGRSWQSTMRRGRVLWCRQRRVLDDTPAAIRFPPRRDRCVTSRVRRVFGLRRAILASCVLARSLRPGPERPSERRASPERPFRAESKD